MERGLAEDSASGAAPQQGVRRREYWEAHGLVELALTEFRAAQAADDRAGERRAFFLVASYYGRTVNILRSAIERRHEPLARAAVHNLVALSQPLTQMHRSAPDSIPFAMALDRDSRDRYVKDLVIRALSDTPEPQTASQVVDRVNEFGLLGRVGSARIRRHLGELVDTGHVRDEAGSFGRTDRIYSDLDVDSLELRTLVGEGLHAELEASGFGGLADVSARKHEFRALFGALSGLSPELAGGLVEAVETLLEANVAVRPAARWRHADVVGSSFPRPYQYEAYATFRGHGYRGQVVEAPTGSGKTMIGMMCIQDWLGSLASGQSILVLVPTSNYQQQWVAELCYKPIGLRLSPEVVYAGTPGQLERHQRRTGTQPAVLLLTYTALAQVGSRVGKGGFDVDSVEMFLQGANVQHIILDEVHKVVENWRSVSADVARLLMTWLEDTSIQSLIGFSGTAGPYRDRFGELGFDIAYSIPVAELIQYGFVAPFAECGVPFADSAREREIRELIAEYKGCMRDYLDQLGGARIRSWFAETSLEERVAIGRQLLGMYRGRADGDKEMARRSRGWETGASLRLTDVPMVSIIQIARGWSDADMAHQAGLSEERFVRLVEELVRIRGELASRMVLPRSLARLATPGFALEMDGAELKRIRGEKSSTAARVNQARDVLATTVAGLYPELTDWYRRVGEGRVEIVRSLVNAEERARPVTGVIVFDRAHRLRWRQGIATPGYEGVGGLFAHLLGDPGSVVVAALSSEVYLTLDPANPLPPRIATFIEDRMLSQVVADSVFSLAMEGLSFPEATIVELRDAYTASLNAYIPSLRDASRPRPGQFTRRVLGKMRRIARRSSLGVDGQRLRARLTVRNVHLMNLITTLFDYAALARDFRRARVAAVEQVGGRRLPFYVVPMPGGRRKQLMYEMISQIVDEEDLGVDIVVVSTWARTGWNVVSPNVLIDATATRNVTAWQQLRGRALRARKTWTNDCYRLMQVLLEAYVRGGELDAMTCDLDPEGGDVGAQGRRSETRLTQPLFELLQDVASPDTWEAIRTSGLCSLSSDELRSLAIDLVLKRDKVTHTYELVKAYGSTSQVTYNRRTKQWRRRDAIAIKHADVTGVNPVSGALEHGLGHAPFIYDRDPRSDLPVAVAEAVSDGIAARDRAIVAGWMVDGDS